MSLTRINDRYNRINEVKVTGSICIYQFVLYVPSDKNVTQNTRPSLYTYVKNWAWDYSQICHLHLRHSCMFTYSQTGRTFRIFFKFTLLLPITKASLARFNDYFLICGTVCVKLHHGQTSISLMLRHWSWFLSFNMLLAVSVLETASSQQWVHDYMSWVRLAAWLISRLH